MQKPSTLKRTAGKDQSATQSVIETNRPSVRSSQITQLSESKPGLKNPDHLVLWVHRFHKAHEDQPGCVYSTPAIPNYHPKFRSKRCHCRDPMSPLRRTKDIQASCSCSQGRTRQGYRRARGPQTAAQPAFEFRIIVVSPSTHCRCAQSSESKYPPPA